MTTGRHGIISIISAAALLMPLAGCFTGIESTPRITAADVRKEKVTVTPEQSYLADIESEPFDRWQPDKRFYVTDDKISLALNPTTPPVTSLGGSTLLYRGYRTVPAVTGNEATELLFLTDSGTEVAYRINATPAELAGRHQVEIPFTVEMSIVEATAKMLIGQKLWIMTPVWYDMDDNAVTGRKFIQVTVTEVAPGNISYPVRLTFTDDSGKPHRLFMSAGNGNRTARSFANMFSFNDPRRNYPAITDKIWDNIINGKIELYMTREECRLALGAPDDIDKGSNYSSIIERWSYENGVYLIFEDGILTRFRR